MMAIAVVFSAAILLLAAAVFASVSGASHPLTAAEATDRAITREKSDLLPAVHNDRDKEEMEEAKAARGQRGSATEKMTSLVSAEEEEKKIGSYWGKVKKLDDDDDDDDSNRGSDSDHDDQDHDSDSDHDHDSDSGHDHDSDSDHDHEHDSDSDEDHDHDSDSDHDHDHGSDSDNNDDDHNSKNERRKKHAAAQGRKGAPGGKQDDKLPKVVKKV